MSSSKSRNKLVFKHKIDEMMRRFAAHNPQPKCELYYLTPYQLLVSVILSAQTTDKSVNRCMQPLYESGFTPETTLNWGVERFREHIKSIGLAPTKAKNVVSMTKILVHEHRGEVPRDRETLESLPGVGRKTANVILGELYGEKTLAVDTHVFRVSARLGLHDEPNPIKAEKKLLSVVPAHYLPRAHHWFILHGRYTCKARKPACGTCFLSDLCPSAGKVNN